MIAFITADSLPELFNFSHLMMEEVDCGQIALLSFTGTFGYHVNDSWAL